MSKMAAIIRLLKLLKHSRVLMFISIICAAFSVGAMLLIPIVTGDAIDLIVGKGNVDFAGVMICVKNIVILIVIGFASKYIMGIVNNKIAYTISAKLRGEMIRKLQLIELGEVDKRNRGDILSRITTDIDQICDGLMLGMMQLFVGLAQIVGTLIFMLGMNIYVAIIVIGLTPLSILSASLIARGAYRLFLKQSYLRGVSSSLINETVYGFATIKEYHYEKERIKQFEENNDELSSVYCKATFISSLVNPITRFVNAIVYMLVALGGGYLVIKGSISVGMLSAFLGYANQYTRPFNEISGVISELQNAFACAKRVFDFLDLEIEEDCKENLFDKEVRGEVRFENVSFSYNKDTELIKGLDIEAHSGQQVAIVGPTGCGKTTLINLLMGFYKPDKGRILLDGVDISKTGKASFRSNMAMVLQDSFILNDTIRNNIAFGAENATFEDVKKAAVASYADSFIKRMPQGYDSIVGEGHISLSAGEKQLICIARAMLRSPSVLILDEATSYVDVRTEEMVQLAFEKLMKGRTSFVVAHRLSTIVDSDLILVMKDGGIVERGSHEDLISKKGFYYELYKSQFG